MRRGRRRRCPGRPEGLRTAQPRVSVGMKWEELAGWRGAPAGEPQPGRDPGCWNHPPSEP